MLTLWEGLELQAQTQSMGLRSRPRHLSLGVARIAVYMWATYLSCHCSQWGLQGSPKTGTCSAFTAFQVLLNGINWLFSDSNRSWDRLVFSAHEKFQFYLKLWHQALRFRDRLWKCETSEHTEIIFEKDIPMLEFYCNCLPQTQIISSLKIFWFLLKK